MADPMTYERKKKFVLDHLADKNYHTGASIIEASNGLLARKTAYQTFNRMEKENLLRSTGDYAARGWEREYSRTMTSFEPWKRK